MLKAFCLLLLATQVHAAEPIIGIGYSSYLAFKLYRAGTYGKLMLSASSADQKLWEEDIRGAADRPLPAFSYKNGVITFAASADTPQVKFDFIVLDQKILLINGLKVSLASPIPYPKAKVMVGDILDRQKHALLRWLVPAATADFMRSSMDFLSYLVAGVSYEAAQIPHLGASATATQIIAAYEHDLDQAKKIAANSKRPLAFATLTFNCSGTRLAVVQEHALIVNGVLNNDRTSDPTVVAEQAGFSYVSKQKNCAGSKFLFSESGQLTSQHLDQDIKRCLGGTTNLFEFAPFYGFPQAAANCCKTTRCPEDVANYQAGYKNLTEVRRAAQ